MPDIVDTRTRIQQVALTFFIEKGYEATSLREIAEELGVTKAALYYHFKTKEDIVTSLAEDRVADIHKLIDWARAQPATAETRREIIRRYCDGLHTNRHTDVLRFFERNQTALRHHPTMGKNRSLMLELVGLLSPADAPPASRLKRAMALFALHAALMLPIGEDLTDEQRRDVSLEVALEMIDGD